jgi:hypothetical protein
MDHIVFDDALTKPDRLVLENLARDISRQRLKSKVSQSNGFSTIDSHSHEQPVNGELCGGASEHMHTHSLHSIVHADTPRRDSS